MGDAKGSPKKDSGNKVWRKRQPGNALQRTFAESRDSAVESMWEANPAAAGVVLRRQCSCGNHTIAGGECPQCRKKGKTGLLQRSTIYRGQKDGRRRPDVQSQEISQTGATHDFSRVTLSTTSQLKIPSGQHVGRAASRGFHLKPAVQATADSQSQEVTQLQRDTEANGSLASRLASSKAAAFVQIYKRPGPAPVPAVQRRRSGGVSVSGMRFRPREIPADGATTSQASVRHSGRIPAGATLNWSIVGPNFGSNIDAAGLITPGAAITAGKDKVRIKVKAVDSAVAGAYTYGRLTLWDKKYLQAKIDYPKFRAKTFTKDPYTPGSFGKFAITYRPRLRRLDATLRVKFVFINDKAGAPNWTNATKRRFRRTFIGAVQRRWSGQFRFVNIRDPKKIWGKLNPVSVLVRVKLDNAAPHQEIKVHKKVAGIVAAVGVGGVRGKARLSAGDARNQVAFPLTRAAEITALNNVTPSPILFDPGSSTVKNADKGRLEFMATYLRRIKNPPFRISITGHHKKVVHAAGTTARQKRTAENQARRLAALRAYQVYRILREGGATTHHRIRRWGSGTVGAAPAAAWDKAVISNTISPSWQNVQHTLEHEAGHMFGLGDEYVGTGAAGAAGKPTTHYNLTVAAFGAQYANVSAKRTADSASLMHSGDDIRPLHYVTFWDGLAQLTAAAAVPAPPFTQADWKFHGKT